MSLRGRIEAAWYDRLLSAQERAGLADLRRDLLSDASGRVLEIGAGTGLNLEHYPDAVAELVLTEPQAPMARKLRQRPAADDRRVTIIEASAEALPFDDSSFDTVVSTLVLCTVDDPRRALDELGRVLKPGGVFLFLEHVRSASRRLAAWQDRLNPVWRFLGNGCNCNRSTEGLIASGPFTLVAVDHGELPRAPAIVRPLVVGRARSSTRAGARRRT